MPDPGAGATADHGSEVRGQTFAPRFSYRRYSRNPWSLRFPRFSFSIRNVECLDTTLNLSTTQLLLVFWFQLSVFSVSAFAVSHGPIHRY